MVNLVLSSVGFSGGVSQLFFSLLRASVMVFQNYSLLFYGLQWWCLAIILFSSVGFSWLIFVFCGLQRWCLTIIHFSSTGFSDGVSQLFFSLLHISVMVSHSYSFLFCIFQWWCITINLYCLRRASSMVSHYYSFFLMQASVVMSHNINLLLSAYFIDGVSQLISCLLHVSVMVPHN